MRETRLQMILGVALVKWLKSTCPQLHIKNLIKCNKNLWVQTMVWLGALENTSFRFSLTSKHPLMALLYWWLVGVGGGLYNLTPKTS